MRYKRCCFTLSAFFLLLSLALLATHNKDLAHAADHREAPLLLNQPLVDINDLYAFRPFGLDNLTLIATTNPMIGQPSGNLFDNNASYIFFVDNNSDNVADLELKLTFSGQNPQRYSLDGINGISFRGEVTEFGEAPKIQSSGGVRVFCGPRDDPFFFDGVGFSNFRTQLYLPDNGLRQRAINGTAQDTFGGMNVAAIVLEIPIQFLTKISDPNTGTVRVWAKSFVN